MEKQKSQILLLTHGDWGIQLKKSLKMILGQIDNVETIALTPIDTLSDFYNKVQKQVQKMPSGSLIITDLFGGTTTNVALQLSREYNICVITGLSAPLLLEAINLSEMGNRLLDHVAALVDIGQSCCKDALQQINSLTKGE